MEPRLQEDSAGWIVFVHTAFGTALVAMVAGIWLLPDPLWIKGYLAIGLFFTVSATITLSKTTRDNHEAKKIHQRLVEAKTEKILTEYSK